MVVVGRGPRKGGSMHTRLAVWREIGIAWLAAAILVPGVSRGMQMRAPGRSPPPPSFKRIIHPEPSLRYATPRYEAEFPAGPMVRRLWDLLEQPLPPEGMRFEEAPLRDIAAWVETTFGVPTDIDARGLEDFGLDSDTPLSVSIENASLGAALEQALQPLDLGIMPTAGRPIITTLERIEENMLVGLYPLPLGATDMQAMIDLIQSTIASDSWDVLGGPASIRPHDELAILAISQTADRHREIIRLMRSLDAFGPVDPPAAAARKPAVRVHQVRSPDLAEELAAKLPELCNAALGPEADPEAKVSVVAGRIVVQSASRPFQVYAEELIRSFDGVEVTTIDEPAR